VNSKIPQKLLELIDKPQVTDILVSSNEVFFDCGNGLELAEQIVADEAELATLARTLIELGGRRLDQANPFADVSLPGGLRVHAVLASACSVSTLLSIRLHNPDVFSLEELEAKGFMSAQQLHLLNQAMRLGQSFLIAGSTGSGKTTLLRSMLRQNQGRVIAIEDITEITGPGIISLQTRNPNIELQGEITLERLVRESLRMRPDRIVIGEVRGRELLVMLQALNTGHRGATTIHANSLESVPERLMSIASDSEISERQLARLSVAAFDWVIALDSENGIRKISKIGRLFVDSGELRMREHQVVPRLALA
jgi:pilus assembly protein CpaF